MLKKIDPAVSTILVGAALALAISFVLNHGSLKELTGSAHAEAPPPVAQWAASATGRVEPKGGEIRISSEVGGRIKDILVKEGDQVKAGDLLVRLDDRDYYTKIAAAAAEAGVRERERADEQVTGLALDRRNAEDAVAKAHRDVFAAHEAFDAAYQDDKDGKGNADAVETARENLKSKLEALDTAKAKLAEVDAKPGMPLPQRLEASLALARSDLTSAELALERTRIRAPADGTVLDILAKAGETAVPSPDSALVIFGDVSSLQLRAEVEERDAAKVHVGQGVVVKAEAYPDKAFTGKVTSIARSLGPPRIATRGPRRPNDVEVVLVTVALDGHPPLMTGMRVDTFFKLDDGSTASASTPRVN